MTGGGTYRLDHRSALREGTRLFVGDGATLHLGQGAAIGARSVVNVLAGLHIGAGTHISWQCQILDSDFHEIWDESGRHGPVSVPITIGEHVLVGTGSIILKGVTIGSEAVIAAGSVVIRDVDERTVVAGNPAKFVAAISKWG
jgi:acetyltransferase-like isoleucine patch superfamily enzyme